MRLLAPSAFSLCLSLSAFGQFVYPKPEYNEQVGEVYQQDPFIVKYRREFFAVFKGDFKRFEKAYAEIEHMTKKDKKDARAWVWLGNGMTVKAGAEAGRGNLKKALELLDNSRKTLDYAVSLRPEDPNIFMMRAATLYIQGQYWPSKQIPKANWEKIAADCEKLIRQIGPEKMKQVSIHVRGEAYGELGIAYKNLGEIEKARKAFEMVASLNPKTDYADRAQRELTLLKK